jgi:threonylcarbamoyladenosine tRNA methylthiotransferase MtaB
MFQRSLDIVAECDLTYLHVFPFSPRPGTPAARMPQLGRAVAKARAQQLRTLGEAALARYLEAQVGAETDVLVERDGIGRTPGFAEVALSAPGQATGTLVRARVTRSDGRRLQGDPLPLTFAP